MEKEQLQRRLFGDPIAQRQSQDSGPSIYSRSQLEQIREQMMRASEDSTTG